MQGLLNYQNDSGEDVGGVFTNPDEISPRASANMLAVPVS